MNRYNNFMNQNNYGWGNAVSDILGAVMQRNSQRGEEKKQANMYLDAANFGEELKNLDYGGQTSIQDLASRANPNSNYTNKTASTQAMQGLLPTSFSQSVPTSDTLGQGLLGGLLPKQQVEQQPQRFFADPNVATDMQPATTPILGKYAKENNPAMVTTSAPKTLQEQQRMVNAQIPKAMKELLAKGYEAEQILPLLKQSANDKIAELTASNQDRVVNELYQGFISKEADANPNLKAMYAARLKQAGYDVTTPYKEFAPEYKAEKFDNGNTNDAYSFNPKTGKYELQVSMNKGVTPDAQLNADTRIRTTGMNNATSLQLKTMGGSGGRGGSGTGRKDTYWTNYENHGGLDDDQATIDELQAREDDGDILTASERAKLTKAKSKIGTYLEKNGYNENYKDADAQINEIYRQHPDATPEEVFQFLNARLQRS